MLQEPHVQVLARHLQSCIDEVLGSRAVRQARAEPGASPSEPVKPAMTAPPKAAEAIAPAGIRLGDRSRRRVGKPFKGASERLASQLEGDAAGGLDDPGRGRSLPAAGPDLPWRRAVVGAGREEMTERLKKGSGKGSWSSAEPAVAGRSRSSWRESASMSRVPAALSTRQNPSSATPPTDARTT